MHVTKISHALRKIFRLRVSHPTAACENPCGFAPTLMARVMR